MMRDSGRYRASRPNCGKETMLAGVPGKMWTQLSAMKSAAARFPGRSSRKAKVRPAGVGAADGPAAEPGLPGWRLARAALEASMRMEKESWRHMRRTVPAVERVQRARMNWRAEDAHVWSRGRATHDSAMTIARNRPARAVKRHFAFRVKIENFSQKRKIGFT